MKLYEIFKGLEGSVNNSLPKTRWTMVRIDGNAFHTYTRGLDAPCDEKFVDAMNAALLGLCNMQAPVVFGYVQSDEISVLLDNRSLNGVLNPWYGGKVQKITSVLASAATAFFNAERAKQGYENLAFFDARVLPIKSVDEIGMYFAWRHADAVKNTVSMAAHALFPEKELNGKTSEERIAMLEAAGKPWDGLPEGFRHGRFAMRKLFPQVVSYFHKGNNRDETKEILSQKWVLESAAEYPGMEAFLPESDIERYRKGKELGIDVDALNEYDVSTARMIAKLQEDVATKPSVFPDGLLPVLTEEQKKLVNLTPTDVDFLRGVNQPKIGKKKKN